MKKNIEENNSKEVKEYLESRIKELNIKVVPGHCPSFKTREDVDAFIKMSQYMSKSGKKRV